MKLNKPIEILYYVNYRKTDGGTIIDSGVRQQLLECSVEDILYYEHVKSDTFSDAKYKIAANPKYRKSRISEDPLILYVKDLPIYEEIL